MVSQAVLISNGYHSLVPGLREKKINNMFLRHFFLENDAGMMIFLNEMLKTMYPSNFRKNFRLLVCAPANQQTKWRQMTADRN